MHAPITLIFLIHRGWRSKHTAVIWKKLDEIPFPIIIFIVIIVGVHLASYN